MDSRTVVPPAGTRWRLEMSQARHAAARGDEAAAQFHALQALEVAEEIHSDESGAVAGNTRPYLAALARVAMTSAVRGQWAAAETQCRRTLEMALEFEGASHPVLPGLGRTIALLLAGKATESVVALGWDYCRTMDDADVYAEFGVAAYCGGDRKSAEALLETALQMWAIEERQVRPRLLADAACALAELRGFPFDGEQPPLPASVPWRMPGAWLPAVDDCSAWNDFAVIALHDREPLLATLCLRQAGRTRKAYLGDLRTRLALKANRCQALIQSGAVEEALDELTGALAESAGRAPLLELRLAILLSTVHALAGRTTAALETVWETVIATEEVADPCESMVARLAICQTALLALGCDDEETACRNLALLPAHATTMLWLLRSAREEQNDLGYRNLVLARACEMAGEPSLELAESDAAEVLWSLHLLERPAAFERALKRCIYSPAGILRSRRAWAISRAIAAAGYAELAEQLSARLDQDRS